MDIRKRIAVWLEETFRECPRPASGPWPMSPEAHAREDAHWLAYADEILALIKE